MKSREKSANSPVALRNSKPKIRENANVFSSPSLLTLQVIPCSKKEVLKLDLNFSKSFPLNFLPLNSRISSPVLIPNDSPSVLSDTAFTVRPSSLSSKPNLGLSANIVFLLLLSPPILLITLQVSKSESSEL